MVQDQQHCICLLFFALSCTTLKGWLCYLGCLGLVDPAKILQWYYGAAGPRGHITMSGQANAVFLSWLQVQWAGTIWHFLVLVKSTVNWDNEALPNRTPNSCCLDCSLIWKVWELPGKNCGQKWKNTDQNQSSHNPINSDPNWDILSSRGSQQAVTQCPPLSWDVSQGRFREVSKIVCWQMPMKKRGSKSVCWQASTKETSE